MFDMKLPKALSDGVKAFRKEILGWVSDEFPMLVLRLVFVVVIFGGVAVFEIQLWMASTLLEALAVILKVSICAGTSFLAWEICVTYVKSSRFSYTRKLIHSDVSVLPPAIQKRKVLKNGITAPPDEGGRFNRVHEGDLKDGDIICLEVVEQDSGEWREFLALESAKEDGELPVVVLNALVKSYSGHKCVRSLVRDWVDKPDDWRRFCFRVSVEQECIALRSLVTGTLLFMMGIKDKTMVAWQLNNLKNGLEVSSWERFELRSALSTTEIGPLFTLWYNFTSSWVKWQPMYERFNITKRKERAVNFAIWCPNLVKDDTPYAPLTRKIKDSNFSFQSRERKDSLRSNNSHRKLV